MATLTGKLVADTYKALLKMIDNDVVTATEKQISDGLGGGTGIFIDQDGEIRASKYRVTAGTSSQFLKADGSLDSTSYLPSGTTTTSIPEGSNLYFTNSRVLNTTLNGFTAISGTVTSADSVLTAIEKIWWNIVNGGGGGGGGYVPYVGATQNLNLGEYGLLGGFVQFDTTPTTAPNAVGALSWNDQDGTLDLKLKGGNVTLQIGQEQVTRVVNKTGVNLLESNYQAVRISGAQGNRLKVDLAQANNDANSAETLGLVTENINDNNEGFITSSGLVRDINTTGSLQGETWADGDILYLSGTTAGRVTNIKPQAPIHTVIIGFVVRAHATQGAIYVKVDNGYELDELHNVKITAPQDKDFLVYDGTNLYWENRSIYGTEGYLPIYNDTNIFNDSIIYSDGVGIGVGTNILEPTAIATFFGNVDLVTGTYLTSDGFNLIGRGNLINQIEIGSQNASDYLTFIAGNAERARITAAGNFGIGLTNPSAPLHVKGSTYTNVIVDNNSATGGGSYLSYQNGTKKALFGLSGAFELNTGSDVAIASTIAGGGIKFYTNNSTTQAMGIVSSGNAYLGQAPTFLGLGTEFIVRGQASDGVLGVIDSTEAVKGLFVSNSSLSWLGTYSNHPLAFRTNNTEWARISSAGNLLIGTIVDNATDKLQVNGTSYFGDNIVLADSKGIVSGGVNMLSRNNLNNQIIIGADGGINDNVAFYSGDLERMRLLANGRLAINKTTASYQVDVQGDVNVSGAFRVNGTIIPNGTVTSVAMSVPTGLVISGSPITSSGTLAVTYAVNYGIPTLTKQSDWDDAYTWVTNFPDQSSNAGKFLTTNGSVLSWASLVTGVSSVFGRTGAVTAQSGDYTTAQVTESGNLYYTDARARLALSASAPLSYNNGTGAFSISQASGSTNGFLSSTDWNTFNNKQNALTNPVTGTGTTNYLPKFTGSTTLGDSGLTDNGSIITSLRDLYVSKSNAALSITSTNTGGYSVLRMQSSTIPDLWFGRESTTSGVFGLTPSSSVIYSEGAYPFILWLNGSERIRVTSTGNVGIGTSSPNRPLDVVGSIRTQAGTIDFSNDFNNQIWFGSGLFNFKVNGAERMYLNSSGNLGLGVTPSAWLSGYPVIQMPQLSIFSGAGGGGFIFGNAFLNTSGSFIYQNSGLGASAYNNQGGGHQWSVAPSGTAGNAISFTQAMTLDASGRLGIGTTSPSNGLLVINSTSATGVRFALESSGTMNGIVALGNNAISGLSTTDMALWTRGVMAFETGASGEKMRINAGGNVSIGNTNNTYKLDVSGTGYFNGNASTIPAVIYNNANGASGTAQYYANYTSGATVIGRIFRGNGLAGTVGNGLNIDNYDGFQVRLNQLGGTGGSFNIMGGNVGIGTTSPVLKLDVISSSQWDGIRVYNTTAAQGADIRIGNDTNNNLGFLRVGGSTSGGNNQNTLMIGTGGGYTIHIAPNGTPAITALNGGNVGIGTTSPTQALTIQKSGYPIIDFYDGATGRGDIGFNTATSSFNIGAYGAIPMVFYVNSAERMRITSGGNVGIGTTSPSSKLQIEGTGTGAWITLNRTDSGTNIVDFTQSGTRLGYIGYIANELWLNNTTATSTVFSTSGSERMRITSGGNVGIGSSSPQDFGGSFKTLDVQGSTGGYVLATNSGASTIAQMGVGSNIAYYGLRTSGDVTFTTGNTERMRITSGGNVGIGSSSPNQKLTIDSGTSTASYLQFTAGSTTGTASTDGFHIGIDSAGKAIINQRENLSFGISTNNTERVLINNSGIITITGNMRFYYANSPAYVIQLPNDINDGQAIAYAWVAYSDARVKKNVSELNYGIDSIMKLKPVSYNHHSARNDQGKIDILEKYKYEIGFIAQEVYNVIPEVVNPGNDLELWGMNYERLTSVIVKGMQEQQVMIETNAEKIARLEKEVSFLKTKNA